MKPVYIFRHVACEGPGYLGEVLARAGLDTRLIAIDAGDVVPTEIAGAAALVFMGGPMSVNDPLPWIDAELALIRAAHAAGMPVLGHCLGGQLIAKALGGEVRPHTVKEIGWHVVERMRDDSPWLAGLPRRFEVFHWHGETYSLPAGATPLLRSAWCEQQAFAAGNTLALQCHVEMTAAMVREWTELNHEELSPSSASVQSPAQLLDALPARIAALHEIADVLYGRWLAAVREYQTRT